MPNGCRCVGLTTAAVTFAPMHEPCVDAERDVVEKQALVRTPDVDAPFRPSERTQCVERIVPVETEIAREVVAGSERDADERRVPLERDLGDGRE
jgi:hypothetical protein